MEQPDARISEIIEMAWDDQVSFDSIMHLTGLPEKEVITLMRRHMKPSSFRMWRKRVAGRKSKHEKMIPVMGISLDDPDKDHY